MEILRNRAVLAPMSGITDLPFRRVAHRLGAGMVVAEMVASRQLAVRDRATLKRLAGCDDISPRIIQISGHNPFLMSEAARIAADMGADMIDINMGCPARKITKNPAGSALMKEPKLAIEIIKAMLSAVQLPISLKMRLGWDEHSLNAADIATAAEQEGVQMFSVHGRTRNQFYKGRANWWAIRTVVDAVSSPVLANGDIVSLDDAKDALAQSGAHGVMIGRGALGRPWLVGQVGAMLDGRSIPPTPSSDKKRAIIIAHYRHMQEFYGSDLGVRMARKHLGWYVDDLIKIPRLAGFWRSLLCREQDPKRVVEHIERMFAELAIERKVA